MLLASTIPKCVPPMFVCVLKVDEDHRPRKKRRVLVMRCNSLVVSAGQRRKEFQSILYPWTSITKRMIDGRIRTRNNKKRGKYGVHTTGIGE